MNDLTPEQIDIFIEHVEHEIKRCQDTIKDYPHEKAVFEKHIRNWEILKLKYINQKLELQADIELVTSDIERDTTVCDCQFSDSWRCASQ